MTVGWLPEALADLERVYEFLHQKDPAAAARALRTIELAAARLAELPEVGQPMCDRTGRRQLFIPFGAGAYVLRYRIHRRPRPPDTRHRNQWSASTIATIASAIGTNRGSRQGS